MKKKFLKYSIFAFLSLSIMISMSVSAGAYNLLGPRHKNSKIYYYYDNWVNSKARSAVGVSADAWRAKTTEATISHYSENPNGEYDFYISAGEYPNAQWDGLTNGKTQNGYFIPKTITVTFNMSERAWNDAKALNSVAAHELGHVFGLDENGTTKTIMNSYTYNTGSRYEYYGLTTPQSDDINGVNAIY